MRLDHTRMIIFDETSEAYVLEQVWKELGGATPRRAKSGQEFLALLQDAQPTEAVIVMAHGSKSKSRLMYTDEAGHEVHYSEVPPIESGAL